MSDYGYVVERARKAQASVSRLEQALARNPKDDSLRVNLAAKQKLARRAEEQFQRLAEINQIEVCRYRLLPEATENFALPHVSRSLLEYQNLFSQVHDAKRNGKKQRAVIGAEAWAESLLEFGYSYAGSLGVVLLVQGDRQLFNGNLDESIDALFQAMHIGSQDDVRDVAKALGNAVVKRLHDWSESNVEGGFAADVRWTRSDGRQLGEVIGQKRMEHIVGIIESTSDVQTKDHAVAGVLVGLDVRSGAFRFVDPEGEDFRGSLAEGFPRDHQFVVNRPYRALIVESATERYATEKIDRKFALHKLEDIPDPEIQLPLGT